MASHQSYLCLKSRNSEIPKSIPISAGSSGDRAKTGRVNIRLDCHGASPFDGLIETRARARRVKGLHQRRLPIRGSRLTPDGYVRYIGIPLRERDAALAKKRLHARGRELGQRG